MTTRAMKQAVESAGKLRRGRWRRVLTVVAAVAAIAAGGLVLNLSAGSAPAAASAEIHVDPQPNRPYLVAFDAVVPDPHPSEDPNDYNGYTGGGAGAVGNSGGGGGGLSFSEVLIVLAGIGGIGGLYKLRSSRG